MQIKKGIVIFIVTGCVLLSFAGCYRSDGTGSMFGFGRAAPPQQGFTPSGPQEPTAVESAIEISSKYAKLSEEAATLKQQKQNLDAENQRLKDEAQNCRSRLEQTQKELADANDLLLEMRVELNNWKNNILGYRDEMRDAEKAQLEALLKILKLLGAEEKTDSAQTTKSAGGESNPPFPVQIPAAGKQK